MPEIDVVVPTVLCTFAKHLSTIGDVAAKELDDTSNAEMEIICCKTVGFICSSILSIGWRIR